MGSEGASILVKGNWVELSSLNLCIPLIIEITIIFVMKESNVF